MSAYTDRNTPVGLAVPGGIDAGGAVTCGTLNVASGGTATIALNADNVVVANPLVLAASSVVVWSLNQAAPDQAAPTIVCQVTDGNITFRCFDTATPPVAANAAAAISIRYLVVKY